MLRILALLLFIALLCLPCGAGFAATADPDSTQALRDAELRRALAEAERAEWLARIPPSSVKPMAGRADTSHAGVAALMQSVELAMLLARELCAALPAQSRVVLYDAASSQGVVAARMVDDGLQHLADQTRRQNRQLQLLIEQHGQATSAPRSLAPVALAAIPAVIRSAADVAALFKSDVALTGIAYGDGARNLFVSALFKACPQRIVGLGTGYLGELDRGAHTALLERVRALAALRGETGGYIDRLDALADAAKGAEKRLLAHSVVTAEEYAKTVDAFIVSLKVGETGDRSPLFNAARFLAYAERTKDALVLDLDLRLDGVTLVKNSLFTAEKVRIAGAAILWYRLHAPDGAVLQADTLRRMSKPVDLDLRGAHAVDMP